MILTTEQVEELTEISEMRDVDSYDEEQFFSALGEDVEYAFRLGVQSGKVQLAKQLLSQRQEQLMRIADELVDLTGIALTVEQVDKLIINYDDSLFQDIEKWGFDTDVIGRLCDMLSVYLLGMHWPTYGQKMDMEEFAAALHAAAEKAGYTVESA